jgi:hypothetical protein
VFGDNQGRRVTAPAALMPVLIGAAKLMSEEHAVVDAMLRWLLGPADQPQNFRDRFRGHIAGIIDGLLAARIAPVLSARRDRCEATRRVLAES